MKLTCPNCKREHTLREPYPAPSSRIQCECGRRLAVQYPPGMVEQLRSRGAQFEGDLPLIGDPFQSQQIQQGGFWRAGVDDEATSLFSPDQIEEAAKRARSKSLIPEAPPPRPAPPRPPPAVPPQRPREGAPDLRRVPDHGPTGIFPFSEPATQKPATPNLAPVAGGFEEEPTALFMADGEVQQVDLRSIPDHGKTGLVYPVSREQIPPAPPPRGSSPVGRASVGNIGPPAPVPAPSTPVGRAGPASMDAPPPPRPPVPPPAPPPVPLAPPPVDAPPVRSSTTRAQPRPAAPIVVERPLNQIGRPSAPLTSMVPIDIQGGTPASSGAAGLEPMAASQPASPDQAFPETASGVRRGATLDEIMRLKVAPPAPEPGWKKAMPKVALVILILLGVGAALAVAAGVATLALK